MESNSDHVIKEIESNNPWYTTSQFAWSEKEFRSKIEKAGFIIKDIYREVFYPDFDRLYYRLTSTDLGFKILELLTILFPSQCSDYYFECKIKNREYK